MARVLSVLLLLVASCGGDMIDATATPTTTRTLFSDDESIDASVVPVRVGCDIDDVEAAFVLRANITESGVDTHIENRSLLDREVEATVRLFTKSGMATATASAALAVNESTDVSVTYAALGVSSMLGDGHLHVALDALAGGELAPTVVLPVTSDGARLSLRSEDASSPYTVWISRSSVAVPEAVGESEP